ncbi:MAG: GTP 3',8-cyclase MoaA [Actinomycetaceae bacterium]|nr:GTP 3',8-cyclase MoaA [Actinomycetaceae bacterium]
MPTLIDRYGRTATDLRVSLTDRCNLRCQYCMPPEGLEWMPREEILTDDEVIRLVRLAVTRLGITKVRFTGGEPLLRKGLENIIRATAQAAPDGDLDISLTTNGLGLARRAEALKAAGLCRINMSLDAANREQYQRITRRDRFDDALAGLRAARSAGLTPLKINAVIMPGVNDDAPADLVNIALDNDATMRFIEYMPLGPRGTWSKDAVYTEEQLHADLERDFILERIARAPGESAPAVEWQITSRHDPQRRGKVGFISSVTQPFCASCVRTRLTADGAIRSCLFSRTETDLRELLRGGASDDEIMAAWQGAMWNKPEKHGIDNPDFAQPDRPMSAIGG